LRLREFAYIVQRTNYPIAWFSGIINAMGRKILIIFILGIVTGSAFTWFLISRKIGNYFRGFSGINRRKKEIKEEHKKKIMEMFEEQKNLTAQDVSGALSISRATAIRYFDDLEKSGKVKQVNKTSTETYYTK